MSCPTCNDWGSVKLLATGMPVPVPYAVPCPTCRPVEHQVAIGGEQGPDATELEIDRLRRRVADLEADLAALRPAAPRSTP
jgi:hypothetical protein